MTPTDLPGLAGHLLARLGPARLVVAVAGPPAAGKSTFVEHLRAALNARTPQCEILPMDGFHLDNALLDARGLRPRKGAPETFDIGGLAATLARLRAETEEEVFVPVFDRDADLSRACARAIVRTHRIVLVEGNYLLLDRPGWRDLRGLFDVSVMLTAERAELRRRLGARWATYAMPIADIQRKLESNDLPNGETVLRESGSADFSIATAP